MLLLFMVEVPVLAFIIPLKVQIPAAVLDPPITILLAVPVLPMVFEVTVAVLAPLARLIP